MDSGSLDLERGPKQRTAHDDTLHGAKLLLPTFPRRRDAKGQRWSDGAACAFVEYPGLGVDWRLYMGRASWSYPSSAPTRNGTISLHIDCPPSFPSIVDPAVDKRLLSVGIRARMLPPGLEADAGI